MKNSSAPIIIFAIALSLATTTCTLFLTVAGNNTPIDMNCKGVPSMPAAAACAKVSGGAKPMAELCAKVLRTAPANSETTAYAYRALDAAENSTEATYRLIDGQLSHNASLVGKLRDAYDCCYFWYEANVNIVGVKDLLIKCDFKEIAMQAQLVGTIVGLDMCLHGLRRAGGGGPSSSTLPLYDMVLGDRDMTVLASLLVGLAANNTSIGLAN